MDHRFSCAALLVLFTSTLATAQQPAPSDRTDAVRVFLDCPSCDENYIRTEITFVNYVRDRTAADVHVLVTTQGTGGGGIQYSLKFIGLDRFRASTEEILIRQRELATDYAYDFGFGISYSFGSIFNNVVNPRFRQAGGF